MIKILRFSAAITVLIAAVILDSYVDQARATGMKSLLLDVAPNLISAFLMPAAYLCWRGVSSETLENAIAITVGLSLYECLQLVVESGVFDINDIFASTTATAAYAAWYYYLRTRVARKSVVSESE